MVPWGTVSVRFSELVGLWTVLTFGWTLITYWWLRDHYEINTKSPAENPGFWSYWYLAVLTSTNIGANDVVPKDLTGQMWLAGYSLAAVGLVYAFIASY